MYEVYNGMENNIIIGDKLQKTRELFDLGDKQKQIPVVKNRDYEIKIDNLGMNGEGVGRIDGYTIFVSGALPGETVRIKVVKVERNYGFGKQLEVLIPSKDRVKPKCRFSGRCGGCQLQHMSYGLQLDFKKQMVKDALERIGGIDDPVIYDTIGMEDPWGYRNKMQFPVGLQKDKLAIGFYAPRSHNIIDIDSCHIQHEINDQIVQIVRNYTDNSGVVPYDELTHRGFIRHVVSKTGFQSGEVMVVIVTNGTNLPHKKELIEALRKGVPGIVSIVQNINPKKTNTVLGNKNIVLWGKDHIIDFIGDIKFKISPLSFYQVNPIQTAVLYNKAVEFAGLTGEEVVIDAYCGIGTISLFMAKRARKVYGIETIPQAVEDARINALENNISNVEFIAGEAETVVPDMIGRGLQIDVAVVDPPRKGCDSKLLDALVKAKPKRIVYVSCNPATLARDLKYLSEKAYKVVEVQPVDMFPQTSHTESIILLQK